MIKAPSKGSISGMCGVLGKGLLGGTLRVVIMAHIDTMMLEVS